LRNEPLATAPADDFLRNTATSAWIAMIATELHWRVYAYPLDWFPPGSM